MAYMDEIIYHQVNDSSNETMINFNYYWYVTVPLVHIYVYLLEVKDHLYVEN